MTEERAAQLQMQASKRIEDKIDQLIEKQNETNTALLVHVAAGERDREDIRQNIDEIKTIKLSVSNNTNEIEKLNEWRKAFDKVVWEIIKPPLKAIGVGFLLVIILAGVLVYWK